MNKVFAFFAVVFFVSLSPFSRAQDCFDCGASGWTKMRGTVCPNSIRDKEDFRQCLTGYRWTGVTLSTDLDEFKTGYIKLGRMEEFDHSVPKSLKVFIFQRWAADEDGNLYMLSELG
jgi:hypothetical protein